MKKILIGFMLLTGSICLAEPAQVIKSVPAQDAKEIPLHTKIKIYFNKPMDKKSVKENFSLFPDTAGQVFWEDNVLVFVPRKRLIPSTTYIISLSSNIRDKNGAPLAFSQFTTIEHIIYTNGEGFVTSASINNKEKYALKKGKNARWGLLNRRIIFDDGKDICLMDSDGENTIKITERHQGINSRPQWYPKNDEFIYINTDSSGTENIYLKKIDGEEKVKLTDFSNAGSIEQLSFSPDGEKIAFLRDRQIWVMDKSGKNKTRLTTNTLYCKGRFVFKADSKVLFFNGENNIWAIDIAKREMTKLSFDNQATYEPGYFGGRIAYEADGLCIMDEDGGNEKRIAENGRYPVFSKNNQLLSFVVPPQDKNNRGQLYIADKNGNNKLKIAELIDWQQSVDWSSPPEDNQ